MAGDPLLYVSTGEIGTDRAPGLATVTPAALPPSGGTEKIGEAIAGLGAAGEKVYDAYKTAQEHTKVAIATTDYLTKLDGLEQQYAKDPQFQTAPARFAEEQRTLELESAGGIDNAQLRQMTMLQWRRAGIAAHKRVFHASLTRETDTNVAALDAQGQEALTSAANAGSPTERAQVVDRYLGAVNQSAAAGWLTQQQAVARGQQFVRSLSVADVTRDMRLDPTGTRARLDDPKTYTGLDPVSRENFKNAAANSADQVEIDKLGVQAASDPAGARAALDENKGKLQPHSYYRALATIDQAEKQQQALLDQQARVAADTARSSDDVKQLIKDGFDVDPVRVEKVRSANVAAAARGDRAAAQYVTELDLQTALAPHVRAAWSMPVGALDASVKRMEAEMFAPGANVTPNQVTAYKAFKAVRDEIYSKRDSEPIVLGGENGGRYYRLAPIDANAAPEDANLRRELAARNAHAATAQATYGGTANVLTAEESRALKDRWAQAGPDEQFKLLRTFGATLTDRSYDDTVGAVTGKDALAGFIGHVAQVRPELAREILQGQALLGDKQTAEKSLVVRQVLQSKLAGAIYPAPDMQETAISAALALDASRRGQRGALYDASDTSGLDKAIEDVTGPIVRRNGVKLPITPGIPRSDFIGALDHLSKDDVAMQGGAIDRDGRPLDPATLGDRAILKPLSVGGTRYAVGLPDAKARDGFAPVLDLDGRPLVFDMAAIAARHKGALAPTTYQEGRAQFRTGQAERLRAAREQSNQPPVLEQ